MRALLARGLILAAFTASLALAQQPPGPRYSTHPPADAPATPPQPGHPPVHPQPIPRIPPLPPAHPPIEIDPIIVPPARIRPWREGAVQLQSVSASVALDDQVATTSLELMLWNPAGRAQEAQLILPVPDGVTVRSFQYDGTGPEPTAVILPRDEARRIYDSIVHRSRDPGLLEFAGYNVIKTSVFPVPPGARQAVRLVYEQVLSADAGRIDYFLPRSEALGKGGVAWSMSATIKSSRPIATVYSASHEVAVDRQGSGTVSVRVPERATQTPGPFRLSYLTSTPAGGPEIAATILAYPDPSVAGGSGGYFLLLGGLPAMPADANPVKREVTLVIDRSGSMRGAKIEQAKAAAAQVIEGLAMGEAFNIIDFSDTIASMAPAPVIKTAETAQQARAYIGAIQANGGTALHDALLEALRQKPAEGMLPMVLFLTDGLPTVGEKNEARIREAAVAANAHQRRVFTFGVGHDVNTPLLAAVSKSSRGAATYVQPDENVEVAVSQVFRRLSGPVMAAPRLIALDGGGKPTTTAVRELMPATLPDFFDGDQVVVLGQYTGTGTLRLRLEGAFLGREDSRFEYTFDLGSASARNGFVPRLWATRKIAALIEEIRLAGDGRGTEDPRMKELVDEIVRLSTRYGILTEYTSFLAADEQGRRAGADGRFRDMDMPAAAAPAESLRVLRERTGARSGSGAVNQEQNTKQMTEQSVQGKLNVYYGARMEQVEIRTVQMVDALALYQRASNRWVDARLLTDEDKAPQRTIEFGTPQYSAAIDAMARENLLWMLTNPGDLYVLLEGERTLIKAP